jgi:hypothetical protein
MGFLSKFANKALSVVSKPIVKKTVEKAQAKGIETKSVSQIMSEIHGSAPVQKFASESGKILTTAAVAGAAFGAAAIIGGGAAAGAGGAGAAKGAAGSVALKGAGGALAAAKPIAESAKPVEFSRPNVSELTSQVKMPSASNVSSQNSTSMNLGSIVKSVGNQIVSTVKQEAPKVLKQAGTNLVRNTLSNLAPKTGALAAVTKNATTLTGPLQVADSPNTPGITGPLKAAEDPQEPGFSFMSKLGMAGAIALAIVAFLIAKSLKLFK